MIRLRRSWLLVIPELIMSDIGPLLQLAGIGKAYGGNVALRDVDFSARRGSIHAVLGENGAGKSTLMKILAGVVRPSSGSITLNGEAFLPASPADAADRGIVCIFQELSVIPDLSVAANICLTKPPRTRLGLIDRRRQGQMARDVLRDMGVGQDIDVSRKCRDLPLSKCQVVEIAKAVIRRPKVLILDEATSALTAADVRPVTDLLRRMRDAGTLILFISHRMHEIEALADTCSIFRNGTHIETYATGSKSDDEIVQLMLGRSLKQLYPPKPSAPTNAAPCLSVEGLHWNGKLKGIDLKVNAGEIVGLGGLDGQGQQEVLQAIAGILRGVGGTIRLDDAPLLARGPGDGIGGAGRFALVPEDRKHGGLFLPLSIRANLTAPTLGSLTRFGIIDADAEATVVRQMVEQLQIKVEDLDLPVDTLSGGNQQKVVIAKWLAAKPGLLLLIDPTRGIDVGTKQEIYRLLRRLADEGLAIMLYTTDHDELVGLCDRALIVYDGRISAELSGANLTEHGILKNALNLEKRAPTVGAVQ
jgi:ribose transport system ATP-binding protein